MSFGERLKHAWNVFLNRDPTYFPMDLGTGYFYRPDRPRFSRTSERTIISSIYNRIAVDASTIEIKHIKLDDNDRFLSEIDSDLNRCLNLRANADQTGRAFLQDVVMSLLDEGSVAIVPVDTSFDPDLTDSYKIFSMRVGKITDWYPSYIKVKLYNLSDEDYIFEAGDKITQIVIEKVELPTFKEVKEFSAPAKKSARGSKGFGSTGK